MVSRPLELERYGTVEGTSDSTIGRCVMTATGGGADEGDEVAAPRGVMEAGAKMYDPTAACVR